MYRNLGVELAGAARATFWIYDDGGTQYRCYGELRGYTGAGHGIYVSPSGMKQLFAIGRYTAGFGNNQTGNLADEEVNPKKYQGKNRFRITCNHRLKFGSKSPEQRKPPAGTRMHSLPLFWPLSGWRYDLWRSSNLAGNAVVSRLLDLCFPEHGFDVKRRCNDLLV